MYRYSYTVNGYGNGICCIPSFAAGYPITSSGPLTSGHANEYNYAWRHLHYRVFQKKNAQNFVRGKFRQKIKNMLTIWNKFWTLCRKWAIELINDAIDHWFKWLSFVVRSATTACCKLYLCQDFALKVLQHAGVDVFEQFIYQVLQQQKSQYYNCVLFSR